MCIVLLSDTVEADSLHQEDALAWNTHRLLD
jgi:hypothetical protein